MKSNRIAFAVISLLTLLALAPVAFKFNWAAAQTDASSSTTTLETTTSTASATREPRASQTGGESTSDVNPAASSTTSDTTTPKTSTQSDAGASTTATPTASPTNLSLTLVHIVGTKYVDYCTDGKTVTSQPGDPAIDVHFDVPNAPTPNCPAGQKWDHTSGMDAYDTPSGDLEVGQYAQQADGTYIAHYPSMRYTSATSTSDWPARITVVSGDPTALSYSGDVTVLTQ